MLHGRFLAQRGQRIGFWRGVAQTIDDRYVTRNNLSKILVLVLQVFEAGLKTCSAAIAQKIVHESILHGVTVVLKIVFAVNRPV